MIMTEISKRYSQIVIIMAMIIIGVALSAQYVSADNKTVISCESNGISITPVMEGDIAYLYLPNDKNLSTKDFELKTTKHVKNFNKGVFSETVNEEGGYTYKGDFSQFDNESSYCLMTFDDGSNIKLVVAKSAIPSVSVKLNNTTLSDITSGSKNTKYDGNTVSITDVNGELNAQGIDNVQIKGRGNSTWKLDKKPYQIKFNSKTSVLGMKKAKKWVLLANYLDGSLLRNKISYDLAVDAGIEGNISSEFADLWIDGEYQGNYLICQKVDSGPGNLDLSENGIVAELDNLHYEDEDYWFFSERSNSYFTLKECNNEDEASAIFESFETRITEVEKLIYAEKKDWSKIAELINEESFVKMYLLYEYTENEDAMKSSVYFYCDGGEIYMGPAWDFDRSLGNCDDHDPDVTWLDNRDESEDLLSTYFNELKTIPEFNELVKKEYSGNFKQALDNAISNVSTDADFITASAGMDQIVWKTYGKKLIASMKPIAGSYIKNVDELREWMTARTAYMDQIYEETYVAGKGPDNGYYTLNSCVDKNITLAVDDGGNEYADDVSDGNIGKNHKFSIMNLSDNRYTVKSLYTGKDTEKIFTDAGNGYYYIQDTDGKYMTYNDGKITYSRISGSQPGAAQKWVLYRTAVKNVENGGYVLSPTSDKSLSLGVENGAVEKKARINVSPDNNSADQIFYVKYSGNGYYTIQSEKSGYVLDIVNGSSESGAGIQQYTDNKSDAQLWSFVENADGTYTIVSKKGTVMSAVGKISGESMNVLAMTSDGSDNQKWIMKSPGKSIADGNYKIVNYKNTDRIIGITDTAARLTDRKTDGTAFDIAWNEEANAYMIMKDSKALTFTKGSKVYLKEYTGDPSQLWYIEASGNGAYVIRCKAKTLMGTSSETMKPGAYIRMTDPKAVESIRWKFIDAEKPDNETLISEARKALFSNGASTGKDTYKDYRFSGKDRFKTAVDIADGLKKSLNTTEFDSVIVASGENYPDALSGSSLVRSKDHAPVLLVSKSTEREIIAYIQSNLSPNGRIYLLGGMGVVSANFENGLKNAFKDKDVSVIRLSGADRYDTNLDILRASGLEGEELIVCDGNGYADSLSASATGNPVMLVGKSISGIQLDFIEKELKPSKITLIGGNTVVSKQVENELKAYARKNSIDLQRIYGETRYETSVKIAEEYFDKSSCGGTATLAYGGNFPDGLSGSSMAMAVRSPLILVDKGRIGSARQYIHSNSIDKAVILGGTGVIEDSLVKDIMR